MTITRDIAPVPDQAQQPALYMVAAIALALAVVGSVAGLVLLAFAAKPAPEAVIAIGSLAAGALATMLRPTGTT
jgi:hypothetical protein